MHGVDIEMDWTKVSFNIKDVIQLLVFIVGGTIALSAFSSKIDTVAIDVKSIQKDNLERKQDDKEKSNKKEIYDQQLLNQVNTNTLNIKLLEQRFNQIEAKK